MEVLTKLEKLLNRSFLFGNQPYKLCAIVTIPNSFFNIMFVVPTISVASLMIYKIILVMSSGGRFKDVSDPIYLSIGTISSMLFYLAFAQNIPLITSIIRSIQAIVQKSRLITNHMNSELAFYHYSQFQESMRPITEFMEPLSLDSENFCTKCIYLIFW